MLRIIFLLLLLYLAFRLIRWFRKMSRLFSQPSGPGERNKFGYGPTQKTPPAKIVDEMKPCAHCGTFTPSRLALKNKGLYFCSEQCLKTHKIPNKEQV